MGATGLQGNLKKNFLGQMLSLRCLSDIEIETPRRQIHSLKFREKVKTGDTNLGIFIMQISESEEYHGSDYR